MLNHILVPLDGSALAETSLPYALQIVNEGGVITLIMIVEEIPTVVEDSPLFLNISDKVIEKQQMESFLKHAEEYLNRVVSTLKNSNVKIETMALYGKPAAEIVDIVKNGSIDAIVMSTHGRTGLSRWILGSVTQKVISATQCPVFVVPSKK